MFARMLVLVILAVGLWALFARDTQATGPVERYTVRGGDTLWSIAATHGAGRRVGQDSETLVGTGEGRVTVRTVGTQAWTQKPGEDWVAIDEPADSIDQIAALREPIIVRATAPIDGMPAFVATYPPGALGLNGADIGSVIFQVHPDGTVEVTYEVPLQNGSAVSHTLFSALTDPTPITAPS